jgi:hypothetical protein
MDADTTSALDYEHAQRLMVPTEIRIGRNGGVGLNWLRVLHIRLSSCDVWSNLILQRTSPCCK